MKGWERACRDEFMDLSTARNSIDLAVPGHRREAADLHAEYNERIDSVLDAYLSEAAPPKAQKIGVPLLHEGDQA